jgi:hypothetical protein
MKPGDAIVGRFVAEYQTGYTVDKVDAERGRVWVTNSFDKKEILSILDVTKSLE